MNNPVTPNEYMRLLNFKEKQHGSKDFSAEDFGFLFEIHARMSGQPPFQQQIYEREHKLETSDIDLLFQEIEWMWDQAQRAH